jgi:streptogramin lyase
LAGGLLLAVIPIGSAAAVEMKGNGPSELAVGFGTAWVGMGDGRLLPVDVESRQVGRSMWLPGNGRPEGFSVKDIAVGFGSVWVTTGQAVLRAIDPRTRRVREIYRLGGEGWTPTLVHVGAGAVWVGDYERDQIFRYDPRSGRVTRSYRIDGRLVGMAAGPLGVWATTAPGSGPLTGPEGRRFLVRVDGGSREPRLNLSCDGTLAVGYRWIWLSNYCEGTVTRLDPRTGAATTIDVGGEPWSIALGAGAAWVSSGVGLTRIAADGAEATLVSPHPNTFAAFGDGVVWFLDCWGCTRASLRTIDASDRSETGTPIRLPR